VQLPLLALQMIADPFVVVGGERNFTGMASYMGSPVIVVVEVLLVVVASDGMLGLPAILLDVGLPSRYCRYVIGAVTFLGSRQ